MRTFYDRLGLDRSATVDDIIKAFDRRIQHDPEGIPKDFFTAYHTLRDPETRKLYDWVLDQYNSGFPAEIPADRIAAFRERCKEFGFELSAHPNRRDTYELSVPARRPPGLESLPVGNPRNSSPPDPPPYRENTGTAPQPPDWWPARPLVLGSRIYHWQYFRYQAGLVVRTARTAELHLLGSHSGEPIILNSPCLAGLVVQEGDCIDAFGLGELAVEQFYHFSPMINMTRGNWILFDGWERSIPWQDAFNHFGIRRRKQDLHDIVTKFLSASCELALRNMGFAGLELEAGVRQNVATYQKGRFRIPVFGFPR